MGWSLNWEETKKKKTERQRNITIGHRKGVDDRKGKSKDDYIEMSEEDIANTRFYGATDHREEQKGSLKTSIDDYNKKDENKEKIAVNVANLTVDNLNGRIGINTKLFDTVSLGYIRKSVEEAVFKKAPKHEDKEAQEWGKWLSEGSRFFALLMPELNSEVCRREMKLDSETKESASNAEDIETTAAEENVESIDHKNKRIFVGDKKRMDNMSNWINSG